jgi:transcriptional regulator with XRE-family HTH domain
MKKLVQEKEKAISLRRKGLSYKEILKEVPVSKSSLSLWLKDLPLTKSEKEILKNRKDSNISRGRIKAASELRHRRLKREEAWLSEARELFEKYKNDPLFHVGIALYWAEGAKGDTTWSLINTDVDLIKTMLFWLDRYISVNFEDIQFRLFIHKPYAHEGLESWWEKRLGVTPERFLKTVYKETKHLVKQKEGHHGCIRIEVRRSKHLLCKMKFFKEMAVEYYRKR